MASWAVTKPELLKSIIWFWSLPKCWPKESRAKDLSFSNHTSGKASAGCVSKTTEEVALTTSISTARVDSPLKGHSLDPLIPKNFSPVAVFSINLK